MHVRRGRPSPLASRCRARLRPAPTGDVCTVTELERLQEENRRLRAELLRARENLEQEREKVAYLTGEIAELRKRVPTTRRQAAVPGSERPQDPLERLFAAIRPELASAAQRFEPGTGV
jgi:predicted  nucleic acid-binding Zn-ribbon protein